MWLKYVHVHSANEEYVKEITDKWRGAGADGHLDVDNLLVLTEPHWDSFFCGPDGKPTNMPKVDKIRLQGKLITRQVNSCVYALGLRA